MAGLAREGKRVVRLGARLEAERLTAALAAAGVATETVPGASPA